MLLEEQTFSNEIIGISAFYFSASKLLMSVQFWMQKKTDYIKPEALRGGRLSRDEYPRHGHRRGSFQAECYKSSVIQTLYPSTTFSIKTFRPRCWRRGVVVPA